jgi:hypothetical protein
MTTILSSPQAPLKATVSGSFQRYMDQVRDAVYELTDLGILVQSPTDPRVVAQVEEFIFVASDHLRAIPLVQGLHLAAIARSDFLWLVDPDGYVGLSAALEIGYAAANSVPVFSLCAPKDQTLCHFVSVVPKMSDVPMLLAHPPANGLAPAS